MSRASLALALLLASSSLSCAFGRNFGTLFQTPAPAPQKLKDPVRTDARLAVTWVGHATTLVQMDDRFVLTDPVFTETVGLLSRRLVAVGLDVESLPTIDAVLISHMHFDHLSQSTIEMIANKTRTITVPEGGLVYLPDVTVSAAALASWQAWEKDGLRVTAVPVVHNGWRYGADAGWRDDMGFTGYVIEYHGLSVYFGGDTAYCPSCFAKARERFPHLDLAILPIAPLEPRSFMKHSHEDPREALLAYRALGAKAFLPIHFDTFVNSNDVQGDALRGLASARAELGVPLEESDALPIGGQRVFVPR
jgi:L-ascorbate metabolism protein UlaG (beta-lactamase superfamily)